MIVLLSPSKNLHNTPLPAHRNSLPRMTENSAVLIESLKKLKPEKLQKLMEINSNLATLNYNRYHTFSLPHSSENATAAIYTFRGEVYLGFEANTMSKAQA